MSREILLLVDALAHEKNVSKDIIFSETALTVLSVILGKFEIFKDFNSLHFSVNFNKPSSSIKLNKRVKNV